MAVFISTLMMVGMVAVPFEVRYFRLKATLWRNLVAYFYSFLVGYSLDSDVGMLGVIPPIF